MSFFSDAVEVPVHREDFASLTPAEKLAAEQAQDVYIRYLTVSRTELDVALNQFNGVRAARGLPPVKIRIPEEDA